jgi:hypothetical protein
MNFYAGIGARLTPEPVLNQMHALAITLQQNGWWLRSGAAKGADTAFEMGAGVKKQIFRASQAAAHPEWAKLAAAYHPAWDRCDHVGKALHARNSPIVLGEDLNDPVKFVVCWTPDGKASGGTGQALRIAAVFEIPVFNLFYPDAVAQMKAWLPDLVW